MAQLKPEEDKMEIEEWLWNYDYEAYIEWCRYACED